jgi:hypothetical protein
MTARIVMVLDRPEALAERIAALEVAGYPTLAFAEPISALIEIERNSAIELLVTKPRFGPGVQNGVSLALTARLRRPDLKILFVGREEFRNFAADLGEYLLYPTSPTAIADAAIALLNRP